MTTFRINGRAVAVEVEGDTPLLRVIRDVIGLTGTKFGCGIGMCGACTVHVGGRPTRSCITPVGSVADAEVTTIEGLDPMGQHPLQRAWIDLQVPQCGYCQSGQIMQAASLLKDFPTAKRPRHRRRHGRQPVPLYDLCPHPRRDQTGFCRTTEGCHKWLGSSTGPWMRPSRYLAATF
jgi:isoquinoline 1-oxidoreductase subunit alpha